MTLGEYFHGLRKFLEEHPEAIGYTVVFAEDDEGNGYGEVSYGPSLGTWDAMDMEFTLDGIPSEHEELAVCIN